MRSAKLLDSTYRQIKPNDKAAQAEWETNFIKKYKQQNPASAPTATPTTSGNYNHLWE